MKTFYVFVYFLLFFPQIINAQWERIYPQPTIYDINFIYAFSNEKYLIATSGGEIFTTYNSGADWHNIFLDSTVKFITGQFVNDSVGYLLTSNRILFKTINGGEDWIEYPLNISTPYFNNLYFLNPTHGLLIFRDSVYKTSNGGRDWINMNVPYNLQFKSGTMLDTNTIFIGGKYIMKSIDGGVTWKYSPQIVPINSQVFGGIAFKDSLTGYAITSKAAITKTTDGGETWTLQHYYDFEYTNINGIKCIGNNIIIQFLFTNSSYSETLYLQSTNNGDSWVHLWFDYIPPVLNSFSMIDSNTFVAAGTEGSGLSLKMMSKDYTYITKKNNFDAIMCMQFLDSDFGLFLEKTKTLIKTTDGGNTFNKQVLPQPNDVYNEDILALNKDTFLVSSEGAIYRTSNSGLSWTRKQFAEGSVFTQFHKINENIIVMNTDGLFKTTDAGITWVNIYPRHGYDAYFINEYKGWFMTSSDSLLVTDDGGKSWKGQANISAGRMSMADMNTGFTFGAYGIYYTTNGWQSWQLSSFIVTANTCLLDMIAIKNNNSVIMYMAMRDGYIYKSLDSGKTFEKDLFSNAPLGYLSLTDNTLWLCSQLNFHLYKMDINSIPVELTSFSAAISKSNVTLKWSTATEKNNYGFEIERKDLKTEYKSIGFIKGKGTTTEVNSYSYSDKNLAPNVYNYRIKQIDYDGSYKYYDLANEVNLQYTLTYSLEQNYPNPFNPGTTIKYAIEKAGIVTLKLYDILGKEKAVLVNERKEPGNYVYEFKNINLSSGVYFYTLKANDYIQTKKMILLK
jgi:photosystem II stability/assembly factor-like uncharacterized protein